METLILDEPDIYLHSDLQKKLVMLCKERSVQVIMASHAVDIIEEVEPEDIVTVVRGTNESKRLSSIDEVQKCISQLGSIQNLKLVHFVRGKVCLFVEGKDIKYLNIIAEKLNLKKFVNGEGYSVVPLEGFSNWNRLLDIDWIFKNTFNEVIKCYVILDRDYFTDSEVEQIINKLTEKKVLIHVWNRKEIENYCINFNSLYRLFIKKFHQRWGSSEKTLSEGKFKEYLLSIVEELKQDVVTQVIARNIKLKNPKSLDESTVIGQVLKNFEEDWRKEDYKIKVISGKDFFKKFNNHLNNDLNIAISVSQAFNELSLKEMPLEIVTTLHEFISLTNTA